MKKRIYIGHLKNENLDITLDEFTKKLFPDYEDGNLRFDDTYRDPELTKIDCEGYTRRSIDDIFLIYRTYRPGIHKSTILKSIERVILKPKHGHLIFCDDIEKWVLYDCFRYDDDNNQYLYTQNYCGSNDEYENVGKGKISLRSILNLMGHKNHLIE